MRKNSNYLLPVLLISGALLGGCGSKRIISTEVPVKTMSNEEAPTAKAVLKAAGHYLVESHDCLWTIAAKPRVYGDSFQWPELFKANRDQIKDPDLIYPKQILKVEKDLSVQEVNHARQMAMSTPKYVPHSKPRESLPVDYF